MGNPSGERRKKRVKRHLRNERTKFEAAVRRVAGETAVAPTASNMSTSSKSASQAEK
jgi:F0F1-type ATP synthase membrane subunit b/b'